MVHELGVPAIGYMSRLDREETDVASALAPVAHALGIKLVPLAIPIGSTTALKGYVDLITMKAMTASSDFAAPQASAIPADLEASAGEYRDRLLEAVAETDDALLEHYLESGELSEDEVRKGLRLAVLERKFMPVLVGTAARGIGVHAVLDAAVELLGSPADLPPIEAIDAKSGQAVERPPDPAAPFAAFVFKTVNDPFAGKLSIFRVVSGKASSDSSVLNASNESKERFGQLLRLEGKKQAPIATAVAGEICAVAKLKDTATGDTLADEKAPVLLPKLPTFEAVMSFAAQPKSKADEEKATQALHRMMEEDKALHIERDPESREIIVSGSGPTPHRGRGRAPEAQVRRRGGAEGAEGAVPRDHQGPSRSAGQVQETVRRPRPVRRHLDQARAARRAAAASSSSTRSSAARFRASSSRRSRRAFARPWRAASSPASPVVDFKVTLFDG